MSRRSASTSAPASAPAPAPGGRRPLLQLCIGAPTENAETGTASTRMNVLGESERGIIREGFEDAAQDLRTACGTSHGPMQGDGCLLFAYDSDWLHFCVQVAICDDKTLEEVDMSGNVLKVKKYLKLYSKDTVVDLFRVAMQTHIKGWAWIGLGVVMGVSMMLLGGGAVLALVYLFIGAAGFGGRFARSPGTQSLSRQLWRKYAEEKILAEMDPNDLQGLCDTLDRVWNNHKYNVAVALFMKYPQAQSIAVDESDGKPESLLYERAALLPPETPEKKMGTLFL